MGKRLISKLGNILRVFKGGRRKVDKGKGDSIISSTSESLIKPRDNHAIAPVPKFVRNLRLRKSKSTTESLDSTTNNLRNDFNELKRSLGTCDIFVADRQEEIKCTRSLNRFSYLGGAHHTILSYNAKLHDSKIWSHALGRTIAPPAAKYESFTSSLTQDESEFNLDPEVTFAEPYKRWNLQSHSADETEELTPKNVNRGTYARTISSDNESSTKRYGLYNKITTRKSAKDVETEMDPEMHMKKIIPTFSNRPPSGMAVEETVDDESRELNNEQRKIDINSGGDHIADSTLTDTLYESTEPISAEPQNSTTGIEVSKISGKSSGNTTEYEVVNMAQVDLFREFKTTIAKMRKVLNVLEVKKSLQGIMGRSTNDKTGSSANIQDETNTNTRSTTYTSSNIGYSGHTKTEGVMAQLSSELLKKKRKSKNIVLNSAIFNYMKPLEKSNRRKKYKRFRQSKYNKAKKGFSNSSSKAFDKGLRTPMKPDKPQYSRCVVYHITQRKKSVDRCVGTSSCPTKKENIILHKTFSALHFGPIRDFPILLDKRENEENKKRELKVKLRNISSSRGLGLSDTHRRKSAAVLQPIREHSCHRCKTQPSLSTNELSPTSDTTTIENKWLVIEPTELLVAKADESTIENIPDLTRPSTQDLVSNILDEEFKTTGLKGKVSNSTMNLIKDQFCDQLNGITTKEVPPDVMITVSVPLKDIVSKMRNRRNSGEDKPTPHEETKDSDTKTPSSNCCELGVQVRMSKSYVNDNLQTIPEKMSKRPDEIYQQNKQIRETTSCRRLATFKKIFGNKSTSCSNICALPNVRSMPSRIFFSEHSTSSPEFLANRALVNPIFRYDKTPSIDPKSASTDYKSSSILSHRYSRDGHGFKGRARREGFFLNLPLNRFKRKRAQISRLFDDTESGERNCIEDSQVLYQLNDSSFYSSTRADDKPTNCQLKTSSSHEKLNISSFPTNEFSSKMDTQIESKFISFSDLPRRVDTTDSQTRTESEQLLMNDYRFRKWIGNRKLELRSIEVNTSNEKLYHDSCTQCENFIAPQESESTKTENEESTKVMVEAGTYFNSCIDDFSMLESPIDTLEKEGEVDSTMKVQRSFCKMHHTTIEPIDQQNQEMELMKKQSTSQLSLFVEHHTEPKTETGSTKGDEIELQEEPHVQDHEKHKVRNHKRKISETTLRTSSGSNIVQENSEEPKNKSDHHTKRKHKRRKSQDVLSNCTTQAHSNSSILKKGSVSIPQEHSNAPIRAKHENNLTSLIRDIVEMCNTSFVKSRDCIVELTLYNLIKEIITEHCSNLTEQSKKKVEAILSNFVKDSKYRTGNRDVETVESAIAELVKDVDPKSREKEDKSDNEKNKIEEKRKEERETRHKHRYACDTEGDKSNRHDHRDRSKSRHHHHRHGSKHRSRRRDGDKYRQRDRSKSRSKGRHRQHHHHDPGKKSTLGMNNSQVKLSNAGGKEEYERIVQRLEDLENATHQMSVVPNNQEVNNNDDRYGPHICHRIYTATIDDQSGKALSKRRMKFSMSEVHQSVGKRFDSQMSINYMQHTRDNPFLPVIRASPKLPVTKIVINLSNLKVLTDNCASIMSSSVKDPVVITDSTEEKQELINKIVSYESEGVREQPRHHSYHTIKMAKRNGNKNSLLNKNKESLTITIHEGGEKTDSQLPDALESNPKKNKDVMRIKMVRKKKTVTSTSEKGTPDNRPVIKPSAKPATFSDIHNITKEYIKREYRIKSDDLCSNIATDLLENNCKIEQILGHKGNLDLAYQRMANFCMFRGLLRKNSESNM